MNNLSNRGGLGTLAVQKAKVDSANAIPELHITEGRYTVRLATTAAEIDEALALRFAVFNVELNEGLESSYINGLDQDEFDESCEHLIIVENTTSKIIGTYRLRTLEMAGIVNKFYCSGEFELESLSIDVLRSSLEIGRASIDREHRNTRALYLLWKGLLAFTQLKNKRYMFGSCSITSQDQAEGIRAMQQILRTESVHDEFWIKPRPDYICRAEDTVLDPGPSYQLPKLFNAYLRFGAKVCSPPAIDRQFKTIDFFVMFDKHDMGEKHRKLFS